MNIYHSLRKDHRKLEGLLNRLVKSSHADGDAWKGLVDEIRDELIPHSRAEEAVFYNAIREAEGGNGVVTHSYVEHAMAETELRTLQAMKAIDINWTALARKLRTDLLHHVEEEETRVFDAARKIFSDEEAAQIGKAFEGLKPAIREQSMAGTTIDLIVNMLPPRFVESFKRTFQGEHETKKRTAA